MVYHLSTSALYVLYTLSSLAVATPWGIAPPSTVTVTATAPAPTATTVNSCNSGTISCCSKTAQYGSYESDLLLDLLGVVVDGVGGLIGFECSSITMAGIGNGLCHSDAVCCESSSEGGLVNIGCVFITL